jgi:hypothetical protein
MQRVNSHSTNSTSAVFAKNTLRVELEAQTRLLARIIRANPNVDATMRKNLGLSVGDGERRAVAPVPASPPDVFVRGVMGRTVTVQLSDRDAPDNKGKPRSCAGAAVFAYVGDEPPTHASQWVFRANTTRAVTRITFEENLPPGTKVWIAACWFNTRAVNGPFSAPTYTHLHCATNPLAGTMRAAA